MWAGIGWVALGLEVALAAASLILGLTLVLRRQGGPWGWVLLLVACNFPWGVLLGWPQGWVLGGLSLNATTGQASATAVRGVEFAFGLLGNVPLFAGLAVGFRAVWAGAAARR